jgi:uncharacterized protein (UPF0335 family)
MKQGTGGGVDADQLIKLIDDFDTYSQSAKEASSEATEILKAAKEKHGVNCPAVRLAARLRRMEEDKRIDFLTKFDQLRHVLKLDDQQQASMDFDNAQEAVGSA